MWREIVKPSITMPTKGQKNVKGQSERYEEVKSRVNLALTPTAAEKLKQLAAEYGLSKSEFVEQVARGLIPVGERVSLVLLVLSFSLSRAGH